MDNSTELNWLLRQMSSYTDECKILKDELREIIIRNKSLVKKNKKEVKKLSDDHDPLTYEADDVMKIKQKEKFIKNSSKIVKEQYEVLELLSNAEIFYFEENYDNFKFEKKLASIEKDEYKINELSKIY